MPQSIKRIKTVVLAFLLTSAGVALAFDIPPPPPPLYEGLIIPLYYGTSNIDGGTTGKISETPATKETKKTTLAPPATGNKPKGPKKLAASFPKPQRKEIEKVFSLSLKTYQKLEKQLKIPKNDVAGSVAAYIAGNYMAYHDTDVPDQTFVTLVNQMRSLLVDISAFKKAKKSVKRDLYEQLAISGTFMVLANLELKQQPNQTLLNNLRLTAKGNIEKFLDVSVDRVDITDEGLFIR